MSDLTVLDFIAYLDPGTGSLLVQFLLGAIVGSGVWFRKHVIATVARLFRFGRKGAEEAAGETPAETIPEASAAPVDDATDASRETAEAEAIGESEKESEKAPVATH